VKNQINKVIYFICLTILSSYTNSICLGENSDIQLSAQFTQNQYPDTDFIEDLFRTNLQDSAPKAIYVKIPQGLVISLESSLFFEQNSSTINEQSKDLLDKIGYLIKTLDIPCTIECSSNSNLKQNSLYSFQWEISTVRAGKIAEYLMKTSEISPDKIRSIGYGDIAPYKNSAAQNDSFNNRIDIVITNYDKTR